MYGFESWTIKLSAKELMLLNCGVGEDSWDFRGLQGDQVSQTSTKSVLNIGRADAEAEVPVLWPPDVESWLIRKDPDAGKEWRREEKGTTEGEMVGWHHQLDGHEFEQAPGVGDGQGGLVCCSPWGHKELGVIERLNWTDLVKFFYWSRVGLQCCVTLCCTAAWINHTHVCPLFLGFFSHMSQYRVLRRTPCAV